MPARLSLPNSPTRETTYVLRGDIDVAKCERSGRKPRLRRSTEVHHDLEEILEVRLFFEALAYRRRQDFEQLSKIVGDLFLSHRHFSVLFYHIVHETMFRSRMGEFLQGLPGRGSRRLWLRLRAFEAAPDLPEAVRPSAVRIPQGTRDSGRSCRCHLHKACRSSASGRGPAAPAILLFGTPQGGSPGLPEPEPGPSHTPAGTTHMRSPSV